MAKTLTPQQERFAYLYVQYSDATKAYREAYNTTTDNDPTVWASAYKVKNVPEVAIRIEEIRRELIEERFSLQKRADWLEDIIEKCVGTREFEISTKEGSKSIKAFKPMQAVQGINELNKMIGGHAPVKTENKELNPVEKIVFKIPDNGRTKQNDNESE